jgi:hypothetical protein
MASTCNCTVTSSAEVGCRQEQVRVGDRIMAIMARWAMPPTSCGERAPRSGSDRPSRQPGRAARFTPAGAVRLQGLDDRSPIATGLSEDFGSQDMAMRPPRRAARRRGVQAEIDAVEGKGAWPSRAPGVATGP